MIISSMAQAATIIAATQKVGAATPKAVTAATDRAQRITDAARQLATPEHALPTAVLNALDNGTEPATDPEVQRIIASKTVGTEWIARQIQDRVQANITDALRDNVDQIIDSWQAPFNEAVNIINQTAPLLGKVALDDTRTILARGGDNAAHWAAAVKAVETIDTIQGAWTTLALATGFTSVTSRNRALIQANPTLTQWDTNALDGSRLTAWEAHQTGVTLELATRESFTARAAKIQQQRQANELTEYENAVGKRRA